MPHRGQLMRRRGKDEEEDVVDQPGSNRQVQTTNEAAAAFGVHHTADETVQAARDVVLRSGSRANDTSPVQLINMFTSLANCYLPAIREPVMQLPGARHPVIPSARPELNPAAEPSQGSHRGRGKFYSGVQKSLGRLAIHR